MNTSSVRLGAASTNTRSLQLACLCHCNHLLERSARLDLPELTQAFWRGRHCKVRLMADRVPDDISHNTFAARQRRERIIERQERYVIAVGCLVYFGGLMR